MTEFVLPNRSPSYTTQDVVLLNVNPGKVAHAFLGSIRRLANRSHYVHPDITELSHVNINHARNTCVQRFLDSGKPLSLWLDSDTVFEPDLIDTFLKYVNDGTGITIIGGVCYIVMKQQPMLWNMQNKVWWDYPPGLVEASITSVACLMVHRQVYVDIAERNTNPNLCWFGETVDGDSWVGEDAYFCRQARNAGHRIMVDTEIKLGHQKEFALYYPPTNR